MYKSWIFSLVVGAALVAAPLSASAQFKAVVKDERGNVVVNTWKNCVETKWDSNINECIGVDSELLTVYFGFDSAVLTPAAKAKLDSLADILNKADGVSSIDIVGYADKIGHPGYNTSLSQRRGNAVKKYLASKGYLKTRAVRVQGLGSGMPVSDCTGVKGEELKACLWRDRRVEIKLNAM